MVQQHRVSPYEDPAVLNEAGSFESPLSWLVYVFLRGMALESFELCSICQHLTFLSVCNRSQTFDNSTDV